MRNIGQNRIGRICVPVPPPNEQRRIVAKVEELFSELDSAVEALTAAREQLKAYRQSVLKYAFDGKLTADLRRGQQPAWETPPVSDLLSAPLCNGRSVKDRVGGFPVLRLTALKDGRVDLNEKKNGDWDRTNALPFLVSRGDFLVARGNGSKRLVGMGGLVSEVAQEIAFPDTMIRLRLNSARVDPEYFTLCWNSRTVRRQIERDARTTAGIYKINQDQVSKFTVPVPPIDEQHLIVSRLSKVLRTTDLTLGQIDEELRRTESLRQCVLKQAFSGQLIARSAKDEPVSALLERIRAERERAATKRERTAKSGRRKAA